MSWKCAVCGLINHDLNRACPSCNTPTVKDLISESQKIDQSIQLKSDIFNASTVAIIELIKEVDANGEIPLDKKQFRKTKLILERLKHFRDVAFQKRNEAVEAENQLRAWQTHFNDLANKLRESERIELKIENINYEPGLHKPAKPQSTSRVTQSSNKYSRKDIDAAAHKYGLPALAIQMTCVARSVNPDEAARIIIESKRKASNG